MNQDTNQLVTGISYSYISYIDEYLLLLNNTLYSAMEYLDEETFSIIKHLENIFLSLPSIMSDNAPLKEHSANQILGFRTTLEKKYRVLHAYQRELHHLITFSNVTDKTTESNGDLSSIDFNQLTSNCVQFVFHSPTKRAHHENASLLLPYIPIKLTKDNYLQYVKKSISQIAIDNTAEDAKLLVSLLDQLFDGHSCPGYGSHFTDLSDTLSDLSHSLYSDDFYEDAELLGETIDSIIKMLHNLYKMTGSLSNLLLFDDLDFETITSLHVSFYDLYYSVKNILVSKEDRELFLSTLPETVTEIKKQLEKYYKNACSEEHIDPLFSLMQTYLSLDAAHIFGFNIQKHAPLNSETITLIDNFLLKLQEYLLNLSNAERKIRMQYFISTIPFIMTENTFEAYLKQAFSSLSNTHQRYVAATYLCHLLESNGWFDTNKAQPSDYSVHIPHNDFDHPHDYGCKEHDHPHDCDCKEHNHVHDCDCN